MVNVLANQLPINHPLLRVGDELLNVDRLEQLKTLKKQIRRLGLSSLRVVDILYTGTDNMIQTIKLFSLSADELLLKVGATNPIELLAEAEPLVFVLLVSSIRTMVIRVSSKW